MKLFSNTVALVLFTLMLFKVSSFHVYTHQDEPADDIENCEICELAIKNQQADYIITPPTAVPVPFFIIATKEKRTSYKVAVTSNYYNYSLFSRPPPSIV